MSIATRIADDDDGYDMPGAQAMLAGTLALMTGHAQSCCTQHKALMAEKVVSNLHLLARHPALHANFSTVMCKLLLHWDALAAGARAEMLPAGAVLAWPQQPMAAQKLH